MSTFAADFRSSNHTRVLPPAPTVAKLSLPGESLATATSSGNDPTPSPGRTAKTTGFEAITAMPSKSFTASYGRRG